jgi:hypothetical protein
MRLGGFHSLVACHNALLQLEEFNNVSQATCDHSRAQVFGDPVPAVVLEQNM